jgi:hypothetical protein
MGDDPAGLGRDPSAAWEPRFGGHDSVLAYGERN